jgi:D-arabinose 1-dehydrogenase-like Zn-dependent alcohol dehydrogenase
VHPGDLIMRRIRILGSQQNDREYLHEALQIAASGKVKVMTETYSLSTRSQKLTSASPTASALSCGDHDYNSN